MRHIIIGTGPSGVVAAETLRKADPSAEIYLIGDEPEPPYSRMAIPYFLVKKVGEAGTHLRSPAHFKEQNIHLVNKQVVSVNAEQKEISLNDDSTMRFDKLLIATGSYPVSPPIPGIDLPHVHSCWTLEDARQIAALATEGSNVVLMGAGFIGCIILESLKMRGVNLSVIEMGDRMVPRMMDEKAGGLLKKWCIEKGVNVLTSTKITAIKDDSASDATETTGFLKKTFKNLTTSKPAPVDDAESSMMVMLDNGESLAADLVITATGVRSNIAFLEGSGIETKDGVVVDEYLQTSVADIYASGDVAQGKDFSTGEYHVQAIQPTAVDHGRIAALNMSGKQVKHNGSINMNVLDTLGLISHSFGLWMGVDGGDSVEIYNPDAYKYLNLRFGVDDNEDVLVGASMLGMTQHIGVIRGLIESKTHLKDWKAHLMQDPTRIMEAYLASTQELDNAV